jgi:hypothetical protein
MNHCCTADVVLGRGRELEPPAHRAGSSYQLKKIANPFAFAEFFFSSHTGMHTLGQVELTNRKSSWAGGNDQL